MTSFSRHVNEAGVLCWLSKDPPSTTYKAKRSWILEVYNEKSAKWDWIVWSSIERTNRKFSTLANALRLVKVFKTRVGQMQGVYRIRDTNTDDIMMVDIL